MPREPLRFIHAAGLLLDAPLRGTGDLADDLRAMADEATVAALRNVVAACIAHQADFLLLTGDTFDERRHSLRARVALRDELGRLAAQEIPVFVRPGAADGGEAWRQIPDLPENVTILCDDEEPATLLRDDRPIAEIAAASAREVLSAVDSADPADPSPFRVALVSADDAGSLLDACLSQPGDAAVQSLIAAAVAGADHSPHESAPRRRFDYVALGGTTRRTVTAPAGLLHCPGTAQGLGPRETGPHGATLVDVAADGTVGRTLVPTAPVRWEQFPVHINERTIREELLEEMQFVLDRTCPEPSEQLWLLTWGVHGCGPLFESLHDVQTQRELLDGLDWDAAAQRGVRVHYRLRLYRDAVGSDDELRGNPLGAEFAQRLDDGAPLNPSALQTLLRAAGDADPALAGPLSALLPELAPAAVRSHSRALGRQWFVGSDKE